ncbi:MAG: hypothetical protein SF053_21785 [Bacteroidia bacterium]|nr:hypothetical protein [Bacteroidia bacterium]
MLQACGPQPAPALLHLRQADFDDLVSMGYEVVPPDRGSSTVQEPQQERIRRLMSDSSPIGFLRYKKGDTTSVIFYVEQDHLLNHELFIRYHDLGSCEAAYKTWTEDQKDFDFVGVVASGADSALLVRDECTNQYKLVRRALGDTLLNISHPVVY